MHWTADADSHMMLTRGTTLRSNTNIVIKEQENELKLQPYKADLLRVKVLERDRQVEFSPGPDVLTAKIIIISATRKKCHLRRDWK